MYRARLKAIGVRGGVSWGGWVGWGVGRAAEGRSLVFLHSFERFWAAVREPKRKRISRMLPRGDGRIRAPRRSFGGSSKGQLAFIFGKFRPGPRPGLTIPSVWVRRPSEWIRKSPTGIRKDPHGSDGHSQASVRVRRAFVRIRMGPMGLRLAPNRSDGHL